MAQALFISHSPSVGIALESLPLPQTYPAMKFRVSLLPQRKNPPQRSNNNDSSRLMPFFRVRLQILSYYIRELPSTNCRRYRHIKNYISNTGNVSHQKRLFDKVC